MIHGLCPQCRGDFTVNGDTVTIEVRLFGSNPNPNHPRYHRVSHQVPDSGSFKVKVTVSTATVTTTVVVSLTVAPTELDNQNFTKYVWQVPVADFGVSLDNVESAYLCFTIGGEPVAVDLLSSPGP